MGDLDLNLCTELVKEMERLGFEEKSIMVVKTSRHFIEAFDKPQPVQKTMLTMVLYNILLGKSAAAPAHVRLALSTSNDSTGWLDDMKLAILPFLKNNEESFF